MSDFKKQSDVAAPLDDAAAQVPGGPGFAIAEDVPGVDPNADQNQADEDAVTREAAPFWHPAWASVQEKFERLLEEYDGNNIMMFKDLPPTDFQVKVLAQQVIRSEITTIMEDIKNAVEQVESRSNTGKRSSTRS